jgi:hypothetical protein
MAVMVFYRTQSEQARRVEDFLHDFKRRTAYDIERVNPDTPEGASLSRLYDIVEYPTIVATAQDGQIRNMWRGAVLPTIDEVSYYVERHFS